MKENKKHLWNRLSAGVLSMAMVMGVYSPVITASAENNDVTYTFTPGNLTAAEDKEKIPEGTIIDDGATGYLTTFGEVVKRTKDGAVFSIEVGKNASSGITFTVDGTAEATVLMSSNGGSNTSAVGILKDDALVENKEGIKEVTGTSAASLTYSLEAGTYKIVSPQSDLGRGARVHGITIVETAAGSEEPGDEPGESEWQFTYFGTSVNAERNRMLSESTGIDKPVSIGSAIFNADGSIAEKGGKFVADSPADGASYYYTVIDPTKQNFFLKADVTVDDLNPAMDGQEGFALMARDAIGNMGESGTLMANLVSTSATKLPVEGVNGGGETKGVIGIRAYTGIYTSEPSDENSIVATRYSWGMDASGQTEIIERGKTYHVSLEKTDYAYITRQYDDNGDVVGEYVYYIPAKNSSATSVSSYGEIFRHVNLNGKLNTQSLFANSNYDFRSVYIDKAATIFAASYTGQLIIIPANGKPEQVMLTDITHPVALDLFNDDILAVIGERSVVFFNTKTHEQQGILHTNAKITATGRINKHPFIFDELGYMHEIVSLSKMETKRKPSGVKGIVTAFARSDNKGINTYGTSDGKIYVEENNGRIKELVGHRSRITRLKVNGSQLYSSSYDGKMNLWLYENEKIEPIQLFQSDEADGWIRYFNIDNKKTHLWLGDNNGNLTETLISVDVMVNRLKGHLLTEEQWNNYIGKSATYQMFLNSEKGGGK